MRLWKLICGWFRKEEPIVEDPVAICKRDHKEDHICWDHLALDDWGRGNIAWPGNESWVCNKCKRAWCIPDTYFPVRSIDAPWAEYSSSEKRFRRFGRTPKYIEESLALIRERRRKEAKETKNA